MAAAHALLIDFGSTYTKLRAVNLAAARIIGSGQGPSTVTSDVTIGLGAALNDLAGKLGGLPNFRYRLASSSAAGGLRMVTVGLVKELTAEAARRAALGAGAKLVGAFAYRLTRGLTFYSFPAAPTAATPMSYCTMPDCSPRAHLPARSLWRATAAPLMK